MQLVQSLEPMSLAEFNHEIISMADETALNDFCRRKIIHGTPHIFKGREDDYYKFRKRISDKLSIHFHEVFIVGSAKLGFSPLKGKDFDLDSDIDVAIVSNSLFEHFLDIIHTYQIDLRGSRRSTSEREINRYHKFLEYIAMGWVRPDMLPASFLIRELKDDWFSFFSSISNGKSEVGNYKVAAGVFKSYKHLETYTLSSYQGIQSALRVGG